MKAARSVHRAVLLLLAVNFAACRAQVGELLSGGQAAGISVKPTVGYVARSGTLQFSAAVSGADDTAVSWALTAEDGSPVGSEAGSIDGTGKYVASSAVGTYRVVATSLADAGLTAAAIVSVMEPSSTDPSGLIPANRQVLWNPGLNAVGGIPNRTAVHATIAPSGGDDTAAIQSALDSCPAGQVVQLAEGTFRITGSGLAITRSNVTLRGAGPTATRLLKDPGANYPVIIIGTRWYKYTGAVALTSDGLQGSRTASLASNPGLRVGELVVVNQLTDASLTNWGTRTDSGKRGWFGEYDRPIGQVLEVASVSGTTVTFTTPFHITMKTANQAHLVRYSTTAGGAVAPGVRYSGIEDLYVANGEGGDGGGNIHLFAAAYSWVKNVESDRSYGNSVNLDGSFRCELRDSYLHTTTSPTPGGGGYGIGINQYAADNLVENNISWAFNKVMVMRASGGGNVVGYNYMEDGYGSTYPTYVEVGLNASHMTTPHMELFEGNQSFNFGSDSVWGNSIYITVFRNHLTGRRRSIAPLAISDVGDRRAIGLTEWHWWYSFIGNVLGTADQSPAPYSAFVYERTVFNNDSPVPMWKLGYNASVGTTPQDTTVVERTIRHGNFDFFTDSTIWDPGIARTSLPNSLYLTAKPSFFGTSPWPWVTPEDTASPVAALPARQRFDALH